MPIYKRCSRCGRRIPSGSRCPCQKQYQKERHREYDRHRRDRKSKDFYGSREWEAARRAALEADGGIDVYLYMTEGEIALADTIHHIIPLKEDWDKRSDLDNLMSLRHETHGKIERLYGGNQGEIVRKLQGMLRDFRRLRRGGGI